MWCESDVYSLVEERLDLVLGLNDDELQVVPNETSRCTGGLRL